MSKIEEKSDVFDNYPDLAQAVLGGEVIYASNESFAPARNLLQPGRGVFIEEKFTVVGKWMDGWETDRHAHMKRSGTDFAIIKLSTPCYIYGLDIDTNHFTGNYCEHGMVEGCYVEGNPPWFSLTDPKKWTEILPKSELVGGGPGLGHNKFILNEKKDIPVTHLRLHVYPDGGVARFKAYGLAKPNWTQLMEKNEMVDMACVMQGGSVVSCSNAFYSNPINLLMPYQSINMGDGWETRRSRGYDKSDYKNTNDWVVIKLGCKADVQAVEIDTAHFVYNFPYEFQLEGKNDDDGEWQVMIPISKGHSNHRHVFHPNMKQVTHVRMIVYPDGGVSRLRVYGIPSKE